MQRLHDLFERNRESRLQELMRNLAERLFALPSVDLFRAPIPIRDHVIDGADENRVAAEIEQPGLLLVELAQRAQAPHPAGDGERGDHERDQRRHVPVGSPRRS